jgi:hypothetical protein
VSHRALVLVALLSLPALAAARDDEGAPGRWSVGVSAGSGSAFGHTYFVVGGRVGYEFLPRLVADVAGQWWGGSTPAIGKVATGVLWYTPLRVYLGPYYAHWFVGSNLPDQDAIGGRAGVTLAASGPAVFGVGAAYEHTLGCKRDCDAWWPEVSVGVRF